MKLEPLVAVHVHPDPAVTGMAPVAPPAAMAVATCPTVTEQGADGCVAVFEHAPANSATTAERQAATHQFKLRLAGR